MVSAGAGEKPASDGKSPDAALVSTMVHQKDYTRAPGPSEAAVKGAFSLTTCPISWIWAINSLVVGRLNLTNQVFTWPQIETLFISCSLSFAGGSSLCCTGGAKPTKANSYLRLQSVECIGQAHQSRLCHTCAATLVLKAVCALNCRSGGQGRLRT